MSGQQPICADCVFLHERHFQAAEDLDFLSRCRAIREYVDQGTSALFSPYVAALLVSSNGRIVDIDERSAAYLRGCSSLVIRRNRIAYADADFDTALRQAIARAAESGASETLIGPPAVSSESRHALLLQPAPIVRGGGATQPRNVACLIFPLGRRRMASVRQLMTMFGLSAAEARLARALCHGETLEEYAAAQGVKLPTVKTQLRGVFAKTQTDRQVALVNLIAGIPPLR